MNEAIVLPKWGMTMTEGAVAKWLKQVGDSFAQGENLAEVETEKVNTYLEAPAAGTLIEILIPEGQMVPVGTELAIISVR